MTSDKRVRSATITLSVLVMVGVVAVRVPRSSEFDNAAVQSAAKAGAGMSVSTDLSALGWFQLDRRLDRDGTSLGRTLSVGTLAAANPTATIDLPEDASAAPPIGGLVLLRADDGRRSRIATVSVADGTVIERASLNDRVLAAVMSADGTHAFYLTAPRNGGKISLWRQALDRGRASQVFGNWSVPELGFGTFQIVVSADGQSVVVQFCGSGGCDDRFVDIPSGAISRVGGPYIGRVVAIAGRDVYWLGRGDHAALVRQRIDGTSASLAMGVAGATAVAGASGLRFALIRIDGSASLGVLDPNDGTERQMRIAPLGPSGQLPFDLVGGSGDPTVGMTQTTGWALITSSGRLVPHSARANAVMLVSTADPASIDLGEMWP